MPTATLLPHLLDGPGAALRAVWRRVRAWWDVLFFGALALVFALSPSTHDARSRAATARLIHATTWQVLPWFGALSALISVALIRIVVVTAQSYGLSQLALEMVVRVLVLELIPLAAALCVLLRAAVAGDILPPAGAAWQGPLEAERWRLDLVPRVLALAFSVLALATVSAVLALLLAYTAVYGLSPWGFAPYTRMVGRVFDPAVSLGLVLKIGLFSLAVAIVPLASALQEAQRPVRAGIVLRSGTLRLLVVLLLIESGSLAVKYF
jgi:phospholipid/cholesterol/gamma-HCH transport system permease protein